jgi:hypothetical protein
MEMTTTLMAASNQWARRPADERFTSLDELLAHTRERKQKALTRTVANRTLTIAPATVDQLNPDRLIVGEAAADDPKTTGLVVLADDLIDRSPLMPTHHAFNQVAALVGAPAGYLRKLHPALISDCLNFGMMKRPVEEVGMMVIPNGEGGELACATGPNYGRIWNADIVTALRNRFGDGVTGDFTVPGEFGKAVNVNKDNTTLYAGDRDMFVFLADEKNRIANPARGGKPMARGFFVWNSEVGSATFGVAAFLFDYVCMNRIVWGAAEYSELRIRHTSGAPHRFIEEVAPALEVMARSSTASITAALAAAADARIGDDEKVTEFLRRRFSRTQVDAMKAIHRIEEERPIETVWDAATAATAMARKIGNQDDRVAIERAAGDMLAKV